MKYQGCFYQIFKNKPIILVYLYAAELLVPEVFHHLRHTKVKKSRQNNPAALSCCHESHGRLKITPTVESRSDVVSLLVAISAVPGFKSFHSNY